jgi:hypothetical protein
MAKQTAKSGLLAKYGDKLKKAHEATKDSEPVGDQFAELPPGIDGGIAELREIKFDQYKDGELKGEYYFYAAGIVMAPEEFDGIDVRGRRTSIMEPCCDTPKSKGKRKTFEDHWGWISDQLKLIGLPMKSLTVETVEAAINSFKATFKKDPVYIKFRTWRGQPSTEFPDPRTQHTWGGRTTYEGPGDPDEEVQDSSPAPTLAKPSSKTPPAKKPVKQPEPEPQEEEQTFDDGAEDLDALLESAQNGDEGAKDKLEELAQAAGHSEEEVKAANTWEDVVEMIRNPAEGGGNEESNGFAVSVGDMFFYKPTDKRTGKPSAKAVQCEVEEVDEDEQTVTLKNSIDGKSRYKNVPFDQLSEGR